MLPSPRVVLPRGFMEEEDIALPTKKNTVLPSWSIVDQSRSAHLFFKKALIQPSLNWQLKSRQFADIESKNLQFPL
jgi:hypothetical protein